MLGYTSPLYILPFDHRASFVKDLFNLSEDALTPEQTEQVKDAKKLIYEGFLKAVEQNISKDTAAILVDEQFGQEILKDAHDKGFITLLATEKSGQKEFQFQYGEDFSSHIEALHPTFTKALLRYNPEADQELNRKQLETLKKLSDYSHEKSYNFLVEPLIPATEEQLSKMTKEEFDHKVRPDLTIKMIEEFQESGVEPDVWKIEGLHTREEYERVVTAARKNGREASVVILGRAAPVEVVDSWIKAGREVEGVIGFAVGRTVFWEALKGYYDKTISREEAVEKIATNYIHFYNTFTNK